MLSYIPLSEVPGNPVWETQTVSLTSVTEEKTIESPNHPGQYYDDYTADYVITNTKP